MAQSTDSLGWIHRIEPGDPERVLLLLHGTGADEHSLFPLAEQFAPGATLIAVRGRSLEEGFPRFFRRFTAVEYDQEHLISEATALVQFVGDAAAQYEFSADAVSAVGYSNGANIALASELLVPGAFKALALVRPVQALEHPPEPSLDGLRVLLAQGARDPFLPYGEALGPFLEGLGADVHDVRVNGGHELTREDLLLLGEWWQAGAAGEL